MEGVLYFPFINVPGSAWLTHSLLYWDAVGAIIPDSYMDRPERLSESTQALLTSELLLNAYPASAHDGFVRSFSNYLSQLQDTEISRRRDLYRRGENTLIHRDKLLEPVLLIYQFVDLGIGDTGARGSEWITLEKTTAREYMAALVLGLCHPKSWWSQHFRADRSIDHWRPATDRPIALQSMMTGFAPAEPGDRKGAEFRMRVNGDMKVSELRTMVLEDLLPIPDGPVAVDELVRFRRKHQDLLPRLRLNLEERLDAAFQIQDQDMRIRFVDRIIDDGREQIKEARAYMQEAGLRAIKNSTLLRILKFIPGFGTPASATAEIAEGLIRHPNFESEPLAYLAFANDKFAAKPRYIVDRATGEPLVRIMEEGTADGPGYTSIEDRLEEERRIDEEEDDDRRDDGDEGPPF